MESLYPYILLPLVAVSWLVFSTAAIRLKGDFGFSAYAGAVAFWATSLLMSTFDDTAMIGTRFAASGAFVVAGYLHAAYDFAHIRRRWLVGLAYGIAALITAAGALIPGLLYDPVSLSAGPYFWPSMALAVVAASVPLYELRRAFSNAPEADRPALNGLFAAGIVGYIGAWTNALMLSHGYRWPWGILLVLLSLVMLANVMRMRRPAHERRILERSLVYSAIAAILSAGILIGILGAIGDRALLSQYGVGAALLLVTAAIAVEPIRQRLQEVVSSAIMPDAASVDELARELAQKERVADQSKRLAELGALTSAIAHEVRNPLGVISANLRLLERSKAEPEVVQELRDQVLRANAFVDDLLAYGRPRDLTIRDIRLADLVDLAISTARQGLAETLDVTAIEISNTIPESLALEGDQAQLNQVFIILIENALLALAEHEGRSIVFDARLADADIMIEIVDDGPGIPSGIVDRLFEPFVTSRKRGGPRAGSGLGLAIARGIIERHRGSIVNLVVPTGTHFVITLPSSQAMLAAQHSEAR